MNVKLLCSDDRLKDKFFNLKNFKDIANLLEIPEKLLLKSVVKSKQYQSFKMTKKSSTEQRIIKKPSKNLAIIQKKLNYILSLVYESNHNASHGFTKERSIVTNAEVHLEKKVILNLDLQNFFGSINFPRIRALFITYFKFNSIVATTLANICCDNENVLPQGASTSPIIANMICYRMDKRLTRLAKSSHCSYTRYADDITFSTNKESFPDSVAIQIGDTIEIGNKLTQIIQQSNFEINALKTRISTEAEARYVTGIKINSKLNVNRRFVRRIRSILHCIEKNKDDIGSAVVIFNEKYTFRKTLYKDYDMFNIVRGKIGHIGNVKGKDDSVFRNLARRYNLIINEINKLPDFTFPFIRLPLSPKTFREINSFVVDDDRSVKYQFLGHIDTLEYYQGSAFLLKGVGIITNYHVIKPLIPVFDDEETAFVEEFYITIHNSRYSSIKHLAKIHKYDSKRDIAILHCNTIDHINHGYRYDLNISPNLDILTVGYPNYRQNQAIREEPGMILDERTHFIDGVEFLRYEVTTKVPAGNSGGPILNNNNAVVAIAVKGSEDVTTEIIPIKEVFELSKALVSTTL